MKKIAVIGAHGVGKTVLCRNIAAYEGFNNCKDVIIVSEVVRDCPFEINEKSSVDGGCWIVSEQIAREQKAKSRNPDYVICDRSAIDPILYMHAYEFPSWKYLELEKFAKSWMATYDKIIYVHADQKIEIKPDGFRARDKAFQKLVDQEFENYVEEVQSNCLIDILTIESSDIMHKDYVGAYYKIINFILEDRC